MPKASCQGRDQSGWLLYHPQGHGPGRCGITCEPQGGGGQEAYESAAFCRHHPGCCPPVRRGVRCPGRRSVSGAGAGRNGRHCPRADAESVCGDHPKHTGRRMSRIPFEHKMAAHCETGTVAALLAHAGFAISEAMVFGISGGIFFAYLRTRQLPFPMFVMRSKPGQVRKNIGKRLKVDFAARTYRNAAAAREALDSLLEKKIPAAVQVDMFNMDYIPSYMKVHFNGHFVTVIGKENGAYIVSDCYHPEVAQVKALSLERGRFARGELAPKGLLFYPRQVPQSPDLAGPIRAGIKEACFNMLTVPIPFLGVRGIRYFARKLPAWPGLARDAEYLAHQIMMISVTLEDRGTGGAGFRFMYATFLQQAAQVLKSAELEELSREMMGIGDRWREISLSAARMSKRRELGADRLAGLGDMLMQRADEEEAFFRRLAAWAR
ncbi:MAG: DUF4872 domain-containing protein [Chitinivibrionales bacterium]|nr:DUF4872 domain-containing protein [Chitinivibrionales bacterium]MBD3394063.1 DUF4872 domain-containing protein [Chitinivibrionales bacterium]